MNNAADSSSLTSSQRRHLQEEHVERQRKYDSLTKAIQALDTDISRALDEFHRQPLQERRDELAAEREHVASRLAQLELQLQAAHTPTVLAEQGETAVSPDKSAKLPKSLLRRWFSQLPNAAKVAIAGGICIALAALFFVAAKTVLSPTVVALRTYYGTHVSALNDEGDRDWKLWGWTNHPDIDDWERFELECVEDGKAALRTFHGKYVTAMNENSDWVLRAETVQRKDSELFRLLDAQTGEQVPCTDMLKQAGRHEVGIVFQTAHRRIVTAKNGQADGDWRLWADDPGPIRNEQKFAVIKQ